jgi:hypothetical protein
MISRYERKKEKILKEKRKYDTGIQKSTMSKIHNTEANMQVQL